MEIFEKIIRSHERFLITTHDFPDGDGLGSEMALHFFLEKLGKSSAVVNTGPTPEKFQLVDPRREIRAYTPGDSLPPADAVFVVDTADWKMLGPLEKPVRDLGVPVVFIDHHIAEPEMTAGNIIDERFASTGELMYALIQGAGGEIDADTALAIYVSIVTDTSSFRYRRTTAKSHTIAAELLQKGVSPETVYQSIYARDSLGKLRLFGHVLQGVRTSPDERIAWLTVPKAAREGFGATIEDTESFVAQLSLLEKVEIGILFREDDDGRIKVSLRGKGDVPVIGIAKKLGGGGHRHAAGVRLRLPLAEAIAVVCREAGALLESRKP